MRDFDFISIDWDRVGLLQAGQFSQETVYHQERLRWSLHRSKIYGVLQMDEESVSRPVAEQFMVFRVNLKGCSGVAEHGSIIDIPNERHLAISGTIESKTDPVDLYVGVSFVEYKEEPRLNSSRNTSLMECAGLRPKYKLSSDNFDANYDWLHISQFKRTQSGLEEVREFIPECMFLSSHPGLRRRVKNIYTLAGAALTSLEQHSTPTPQVFAAAMALAGSLGPAAHPLDARHHPLLYLDMLHGVFAAQRSQLRILPKPNLTDYQDALDQFDKTLSDTEEEWNYRNAFDNAEACFERLIKLYPALLKSLELVGPAPPKLVGETETVVRAAPSIVATNNKTANVGRQRI